MTHLEHYLTCILAREPGLTLPDDLEGLVQSYADRNYTVHDMLCELEPPGEGSKIDMVIGDVCGTLQCDPHMRVRDALKIV